MIYKFLIVSEEVEDFKRVIKIDAEATFKELNDAILDSVGYNHNEMTSFFICDDDWEKRVEVTLIDMGRDSSEDSWLMDSTHLNELVEDEGQRLMFVFDYLTNRAFFMEMKELVPSKSLADPLCSRKEGRPPKQVIDMDEFENKINNTASASGNSLDDLDADFYGSDDFNLDEFDEEGFDDLKIE